MVRENRIRAMIYTLVVTSMTANSAWSDTDNASHAAFRAFFTHNVPLADSGSGSFTVTATLGGVRDEFLLDTGASMITISPKLFAKVRRHSEFEKVSQIGARLANGKLKVLNVYRVSDFKIGDRCDLGSVEVAVFNSGERNLLGMNVLQQAAPFAISTSPPTLGLANCITTLAAR